MGYSTPIQNTIDQSSLQLELHIPDLSSIDSKDILQENNSSSNDNCITDTEGTTQGDPSLSGHSENAISKTDESQIDSSKNDPSYYLNENSYTISHISSSRNNSSIQETFIVGHPVNVKP